MSLTHVEAVGVKVAEHKVCGCRKPQRKAQSSAWSVVSVRKTRR